MDKKKIGIFLAAVTGLMSVPMISEAKENETHEPITLMDANRDYTKLIELVHQTYPEINVEIVPYKGRNTTAYTKKQLVTGIMPDIYCTTQAWDGELQKEHLIDLSSYPISDLYNQVRLNEFDVDGGIYLLSYDYTITGITYNKTLLEKNNIEVPTSFQQLRDETIPALEAARIEVSACMMNLPGYPFQYFFNVADTGFTNTIQGRVWQKQFIDGEVGASEALQSSIDSFQQWIDCGMVNMNYKDVGDNDMLTHFKEGNTAFLMGSLQCFSQNEDGSGDQYGILPYFSEDGTENVYITQNARCYGLNKELEKEGNEQKLEDAMHVLEIMSSNEGYGALFGTISSSMCSIRDFQVQEDSPYIDIVKQINNGYAASLIYTGWENYIATFGDSVESWISGDITGEEAVATLDQKQAEEKENGTTYYANVTEVLDTKQAAQLCGQIFLEATDADAALISYNIYQPEVLSNQENGYGANGQVLPGEMTAEDITIFLPTGWTDTLKTAQLSGKEIKQMAKDGCDLRDNGYPYPYVFLTKDGNPLADDETYTVVICGIQKSKMEELNLQDTGMIGLDAAKEYFLRVGEVSTATLDDTLVQTVE